MTVTERKFVLVNNTKGHIDGVVVVQDDRRKTVILYPGHNEVPADLWGLAMLNPIMADKEKSGQIKVSPKGFMEMAENDAVSVVSQTSDPRLLKIWRDKDGRPKVRNAISEALGKIFGDKQREV